MALDDFKDDDNNPLRKDPPNEDKWRHEEPGVPNWEKDMDFEEKEVDLDQTAYRLILTMTKSDRFISDLSQAWISSRIALEIKLWR